MFYTCKNAIILFLQIYRLIAIYNESEEKETIPDFSYLEPEVANKGLQQRKSVFVSLKNKQLNSKTNDDIHTSINNKHCKCDCHSKFVSGNSHHNDLVNENSSEINVENENDNSNKTKP